MVNQLNEDMVRNLIQSLSSLHAETKNLEYNADITHFRDFIIYVKNVMVKNASITSQLKPGQ